MKLWLDDERPAPEGWTHVRTTAEAIELLESGRVVEVSLDHDLGTETDGYDVACFIENAAALRRLPRLTWNVHSANPPGAARMRAALERADRFWDYPATPPA